MNQDKMLKTLRTVVDRTREGMVAFDDVVDVVMENYATVMQRAEAVLLGAEDALVEAENKAAANYPVVNDDFTEPVTKEPTDLEKAEALEAAADAQWGKGEHSWTKQYLLNSNGRADDLGFLDRYYSAMQKGDWPFGNW